MATPRSPGTPALEGILLPPEDEELHLKVRRAVPGLAVLGRDPPTFVLPGDSVERAATECEFEIDLATELLQSLHDGSVQHHRAAAASNPHPLILHVNLPPDPDDALLYGAAVAGSLLCDGIGDAVRFGGPHEPERLLEMVLGVLQACRLRASRTEYIACPGCGRTLFDLESTTQRIKARTGHLPGVKIAVMGCIVNGPGEMADADFGYVGSSPGFVNLYVGKDVVERNVPQAEADDRLVALMKSKGVWREPAATA